MSTLRNRETSGGTGPAVEPRQYKRRGERRSEIIEATIAILSESGLHAWTTSALAERVGVSEATLFRHFKSKDEILVAALRHQIHTLQARIKSYQGEGGPWDRVRGLVDHVLEFVHETAGGPLIIMTGQAIRILPAIRDDVNATRTMFREKLIKLVEQALADARPREVFDPGQVADLIVAIVHSTGLRWIVSDGSISLTKTAGGMLDVLARSLGGEEQGGEGSKGVKSGGEEVAP